MNLSKRFIGTDIPADMSVAVERNGTVIGYAKTEVEADEYIRVSTDPRSADAFFAGRQQHRSDIVVASGAIGNQIAEEAPQETKQHLKRIDHFRRMFDEGLLNRVSSPNAQPGVLYCTWEEFEKMYQEYKCAIDAGEGRDFPFQPVSAYVHRLVTSKGKVIRHLFVNECGIWTNRAGESKICILKNQGPGDLGEKYFQVPGTAVIKGDDITIKDK